MTSDVNSFTVMKQSGAFYVKSSSQVKRKCQVLTWEDGVKSAQG